MTIDVEAIRAEYRETVAATAHGGTAADFATLAACLPALCDALTAERERVRVLETENAEIRAANEELDEMFDLNPLRRASNEQIWAELDERCARYSYSPKIADLRRERARLYRDVSAERERVKVLRAALHDAMRHTHSVPMAAFDTWQDALAATDDGGGA
jgi:hypothetical protein